MLPAASRGIVPDRMLQAHSLLWYYLWVAPSVLLLVLAPLMWRRNLHREHPFFFAFALVSAIEQLALWIGDSIPTVSATVWWEMFWVGLLAEGLLKFVLIGQIFGHVFDPYASLAKLGKFLIRAAGVALVLAAGLVVAYAPRDSPYGIINGAHLLPQAIYLIESGLLLSVFAFSAYFHLVWKRQVFGIALGLAISSCVHLATWAVATNLGLPSSKRVIFDFVNMATFHGCVLLWYYYLLVPHRATAKAPDPTAHPAGALPELEVWNAELERLLHR